MPVQPVAPPRLPLGAGVGRHDGAESRRDAAGRRRRGRHERRARRRRVADPRRLADQVLRDERVQHEQDDARDEEEERERRREVKLGPEVFARRTARRLHIVRLRGVLRQSYDWTLKKTLAFIQVFISRS